MYSWCSSARFKHLVSVWLLASALQTEELTYTWPDPRLLYTVYFCFTLNIYIYISVSYCFCEIILVFCASDVFRMLETHGFSSEDTWMCFNDQIMKVFFLYCDIKCRSDTAHILLWCNVEVLNWVSINEELLSCRRNKHLWCCWWDACLITVQ